MILKSSPTLVSHVMSKWLSSRDASSKDVMATSEGEHKTILGWVASKRVVGGVSFLLIRDATGYVQVAVKKGSAPDSVFNAVRQVSLESAVLVGGMVRADERAPGGREVAVQRFEVISPSEKWPITRSAARSASFLYDKRHLSIRGRKAAAVIRIRAEFVYSCFDFFRNRGFTLISAPTIVQNAVEGGATLFKVDYFGEPAFLSQSAQLYEEAAICALEKVFIFQPAFRAEKSKTPKHLTEFWMVEAEQAFADQSDNLKLQEELVESICQRIVENRAEDLRILGRKLAVPKPPFPRLTYDDVREMAQRKGSPFERGVDVPTEVEAMISKSFESPVFVTDYPLSARSFYHMNKGQDDEVTLSADLFAPEGYGEISTGGQRIHDYSVLLDRVSKQELPREAFEWYLELRNYGLPPHSGFGMGVERTIRWICGLRHIRGASLFPRTITRVTP